MNDELESIGLAMLRVLPRDWVYRVVTVAEERPAYRGLLTMWRDAEDDAERDAVIADLQDLLDDREPGETAAIRSREDLHRVYAERKAFKDHLRTLVDEAGGVSAVARRAEMPQPSLSRLLNSTAEPRAATLARLAAALGVTVARLRAGPDVVGEVLDMDTERRRVRYRRDVLRSAKAKV